MTDENAPETSLPDETPEDPAFEGADGVAGDAPAIEEPGVTVSTARVPPILEDGPGLDDDGRNLDLLLDVSVPITAEIGRTELPLAEILRLGPGSVIELDKSADEPVEILVNGKMLATAEVVVVGDRFGVRILDVVERGES
jgi:flagellar motor switch protein FliN/FliY